MLDNKLIDELKRRRELYAHNFQKFAHDCLLIRTKNDGLKRFVLNDVQKDFLYRFEKQLALRKNVRFIVLKARQQGISTLIEGLIYWMTIYHKGYKSLVLTHLDSATKELFEMTRRFHQNMHELLKPSARNENVNEITFKKIDSSIKTATAGSKNVGHGSTFQALHWSEVSRSKNQKDIVAGVLQAVPSGDKSMIFLESTANGVGDFFHKTWQAAVRGENVYEPVFYPWFNTKEYRMSAEGVVFTDEERAYQRLYSLSDEQMAWRQYMIANNMGTGSLESRENLFKEQYPSNADEAFISDDDSFIDPHSVEAAMNNTFDGIGAVIIGVDPARQGRDSTGVVVRKGRKVLYAGRWRIEDTMSIVGRVVKLIDEYKADAVFVDAIGVGAGVYDRLKELGYNEVMQAISSKKAEKYDTYINKRAEMWANMGQWLADGADLPRSDAIRDDLLLLSYSLDSNGRLKLQSKKNISRSPDVGDALALTFFTKIKSKEVKSELNSMRVNKNVSAKKQQANIKV